MSFSSSRPLSGLPQEMPRIACLRWFLRSSVQQKGPSLIRRNPAERDRHGVFPRLTPGRYAARRSDNKRGLGPHVLASSNDPVASPEANRRQLCASLRQLRTLSDVRHTIGGGCLGRHMPRHGRMYRSETCMQAMWLSTANILHSCTLSHLASDRVPFPGAEDRIRPRP